MLARLNKYGAVFGTDFSDEAVAFSNLVFPNEGYVKQGYLPNGIPFEREQFDIITALDVLEYIEDDKASAQTLLGLLKGGGGLIVTVPAYMSLWSNHDVVLEHKRRYTKPQLLALFDGLDCEIMKSTYFNSVLLPLIWVVRKLNNLLRPDRVETDDELPNSVINNLFSAIMRFECAWLRKHTLPAGVSVMAVVRKA
jgi:SAM-dependent methyltransferase